MFSGDRMGGHHGDRSRVGRQTAFGLQDAGANHRERRAAEAANEGAAGTGDARRVDRSLGVREERPGGEQERELAQRDNEEDPEGGVRGYGSGDAAGSQREFRATDGGQTPDAIHGL